MLSGFICYLRRLVFNFGKFGTELKYNDSESDNKPIVMCSFDRIGNFSLVKFFMASNRRIYKCFSPLGTVIHTGKMLFQSAHSGEMLFQSA